MARNALLAREMARCGLTYAQLASLARVGRTSITRALQGASLRRKTAWAIAKALGKEPQDLDLA